MKEVTTTSQRHMKNHALYHLFLTEYNTRANTNKKNGNESSASLVEHYDVFMQSPAVFDYFFLMGNLTSLLAHFYESDVKNAPDVAATLHSVCSISDRKSIASEMSVHLNKLERLMSKQMTRTEANESFRTLVVAQWRRRIKEYLDVPSRPTDRITVLEEVFGFNLTNQPERHEQLWSEVILESLGQRDFYHQEIVRRLEPTAATLARHFATIRNVVTFKPLVMLTIWSYAHNDCIGDGGDEHALMGYGDFAADYRIFKALTLKNTPVHLTYIDFALPRHADAIILHMKSDKEGRAFDDLFRSGVLELSEMIPATTIAPEYLSLLQTIAESDAKKPSLLLDNTSTEEEDDDY